MDNVNLWFAYNENKEIIHINEVNEDNKTKYVCPICGSAVIPKAIGVECVVTPHFAHIDKSKCSSEGMIHWWIKNKFIEIGTEFKITNTDTSYICKSFEIEKSFKTEDGIYRPDLIVNTECGKRIFFEVYNTNKKKMENYMNKWIELDSDVIQIDANNMPNLNSLRLLYSDGQCFDVGKIDRYYNSIGKYKEKLLKKIGNDKRIVIKKRLNKLDWFWKDIIKYKLNKITLEEMCVEIDNIDKKDCDFALSVLKSNKCNDIYYKYKQKEKEKLEYLTEANFKLIKEKYISIMFVILVKTLKKHKIPINKIDIEDCFDFYSRGKGDEVEAILKLNYEYYRYINNQNVEFRREDIVFNIQNHDVIIKYIEMIIKIIKEKEILEEYYRTTNEIIYNIKDNTELIEICKNNDIEITITDTRTNKNILKSKNLSKLQRNLKISIYPNESNDLLFRDVLKIKKENCVESIETFVSKSINKIKTISNNYNEFTRLYFLCCDKCEKSLVKINLEGCCFRYVFNIDKDSKLSVSINGYKNKFIDMRDTNVTKINKYFKLINKRIDSLNERYDKFFELFWDNHEKYSKIGIFLETNAIGDYWNYEDIEVHTNSLSFICFHRLNIFKSSLKDISQIFIDIDKEFDIYFKKVIKFHEFKNNIKKGVI